MLDGLIHSIVEQRDLEIHFMPIVRFWSESDVSRWSPFAFEALIRGPRGSPLRRPDDLFAAAQKAGLRNRLELMCLEAAFEKMPAMPESSLLFLNVGAPTFIASGFNALLEKWKERIDPSRVVFEIVEGEVPDVKRFRRQMERGRKQGFRYALDDLPTDGEASRRMVEAGPVAFLKIDRSFIGHWLQDRGRIRDWLEMVYRVAQQTKADLILEGIETPMLEWLPELSSLGVRLAQGFMFGEPAILGPGFHSWRRGFRREVGPMEGREQPLEAVSRAAADRLRGHLPTIRRRASIR